MDHTMVLSYDYNNQKAVAANECTSIAGHFDGHGNAHFVGHFDGHHDAAVLYHAHRPMEGVHGFYKSHLTPPSDGHSL